MKTILLFILFLMLLTSCVRNRTTIIYHDQVESYVSVESGDTLHISNIGGTYYIIDTYNGMFPTNIRELKKKDGSNPTDFSSGSIVFLIMAGMILIYSFYIER